MKAGALGLQSNFIKFHLFIDNNQWAAEGGRVLALNCEVFIEWTLANINSPQWGQIIRAASYKSVKQEYCLLSRQHPIHTGVDTTQPSHDMSDDSQIWFCWSSVTFVKSIRITLTREIACDLCWDGWVRHGTGKSWELSSRIRRKTVKNMFRVANVQRSINHHGTAAEDLNGNWLVFVLRGGYYKWHGNCRSDCLIDWHSPAKTCNFSLVLTFALIVCCPQKCALLPVTPPNPSLLTRRLWSKHAGGDQSEAVIVISEWQIADYNTSSDQNIYRHKAPHSRLSDPILSCPGAMFDPCPDILMLCCDNVPGRQTWHFVIFREETTEHWIEVKSQSEIARPEQHDNLWVSILMIRKYLELKWICNIMQYTNKFDGNNTLHKL